MSTPTQGAPRFRQPRQVRRPIPRTCRTVFRRTLIAALSCAAFSVSLRSPTAEARPGHGLLTGFSDLQAFQRLDDAQRQAAFANLRAVRGSVVRVLSGWNEIAPERPPTDADARNPAWPGYRWTELDRAVRETTAAGATVLLAAHQCTARGPTAPAAPIDVPAGTWKPSAPDYRLFAEAIARRYSGSFVDASGQPLPRVRYYQPWNEPNLANFLNPQWIRVRGRFRPASPGIYKALLNAFYKGAKSVSASNFIVSAGTAPFGESEPGGRACRRPSSRASSSA